MELPHAGVQGSNPGGPQSQSTSGFFLPPSVIPASPLEQPGHPAGTAVSDPPTDLGSSHALGTSRVPDRGPGASVPGTGVSAHRAATWRHHGFSWRLRGGSPHQAGWWAKEGLALGGRLLRNHVLLGIIIGFVLLLSTVGPKFLDPGASVALQNVASWLGFKGRGREQRTEWLFTGL